MAPSPPDTPTHTLPAAAARTLADPSLRLELHGISFSHYVERARWALRLLGLPYTEVCVRMCGSRAACLCTACVCAGPHPHTVRTRAPLHAPMCAAIRGTQVGYLPMLHISGILRLQKKFRQGPGKPTASSKSPAATPCLAIYTRDGQPLWCGVRGAGCGCLQQTFCVIVLPPPLFFPPPPLHPSPRQPPRPPLKHVRCAA
jgi:hypothetical protein